MVVGLSWIHLFQGNFNPAAEGFAQAVSASQQRKHAPFLAAGFVGQAIAALRIGREDSLAHALGNSQTALELLGENADRSFQIMAYGALAATQLRRDQYQSAYDAAEKGLALIEETAPLISMFWTMEGYMGVAETYLGLWETLRQQTSSDDQRLARASQRILQAVEKFGRTLPMSQPRILLWQGLHDWLADKPGPAQAAWRKSFTQANRLAMPYEQGLAHYEIGRHLASNDPRRRQHLSQARKIFKTLGAGYDLERVLRVAG